MTEKGNTLVFSSFLTGHLIFGLSTHASKRDDDF